MKITTKQLFGKFRELCKDNDMDEPDHEEFLGYIQRKMMEDFGIF